MVLMPINIKLEYATEFKRNIRILSKKHRRIKDDLSGLLVDLARGETPGDQIRGTGATLYKVRVKNSDSSKGKSGGYRIVYYVKHEDSTVLLTIYSKSDQRDISASILRKLVEKYEL
jgi:mRNA-degrading endonuclease RelE of RelBE toxin-antitoxin system